MKKREKKLLWKVALLTMVCAIVLLLPVQTQAASAKKKALKAYKTFLSKQGSSTSYDDITFSIIYLNNDSVPELVFCKDTVETIYTYKNGAMKVIGNGSTDSVLGYYKKTGIVKHQGSFYERYERMKSGKLADYLYVNYNFGTTNKNTYYKYSGSLRQQITNKKYQKLLKKYVGSKKLKTVKYHKNTAKNRKKYLK
ncbi:MAG: hypothetical protein LUF92_08335 [Clostridiales bacterium]|nr:hypothetical protein [Clostridiales bacterium]